MAPPDRLATRAARERVPRVAPRRTWRCRATSQSPNFCASVRLNSAVGYITPKDMLAGRQQEIHAERDRSWRRRESSGRFVGSLRDTLWRHCTRSPLSRKLPGPRPTGFVNTTPLGEGYLPSWASVVGDNAVEGGPIHELASDNHGRNSCCIADVGCRIGVQQD